MAEIQINGLKFKYVGYKEKMESELNNQLKLLLNKKYTEKDINKFSDQIMNLLKNHYHINIDTC